MHTQYLVARVSRWGNEAGILSHLYQTATAWREIWTQRPALYPHSLLRYAKHGRYQLQPPREGEKASTQSHIKNLLNPVWPQAPLAQSSTHFTNQPHPLMVCVLYLYDNDSGEILKTHPFILLTNLEERRGRASGLPAAIYSFYYGPWTLQKLRPGALHARRRVQRGGVS